MNKRRFQRIEKIWIVVLTYYVAIYSIASNDVPYRSKGQSEHWVKSIEMNCFRWKIEKTQHQSKNKVALFMKNNSIMTENENKHLDEMSLFYSFVFHTKLWWFQYLKAKIKNFKPEWWSIVCAESTWVENCGQYLEKKHQAHKQWVTLSNISYTM